jgi:hypothetical protein
MAHPLVWWSSLPPSKRLRVAAVLLLTLGLAGACLFYRVETRSPAPTIDDLMPGYSRARSRQIGIMMGDLGVTLMAWLDALKEPGTQALLIAGVSGLAAWICFRLARLLDRPIPDAHPVPPASSDDRRE